MWQQRGQSELSSAAVRQWRVPRYLHLLLFLLCIGMGVVWDQSTALAADPVLSIASETKNIFNGTKFQVPVVFTANGSSVAYVSFSLDIDQNCLTFDNVTDSNGDGIPNSVTGLPSGLLFVSTVSYNASDTDGEIDIAIYDTLLPIGPLSTGPLVTLEFMIKPGCRTTDGSQPAISFPFSSAPAPSFAWLLGIPVNGSATGGTITLRFNANPTDIMPNAMFLYENQATGTTVGTLTSTDIDLSPAVPSFPEAHTYSLVSGAGATDNDSFTLTGNTLKTSQIFNYETKSSYSIRLRTTDNFAGTFEEVLTITVGNVNEAPTSLSLSANTVDENLSSSVTVGTLSSIDPDVGSMPTYALVSGLGDTANSEFTISGNVLSTGTNFDYETASTQNIRVRVTDNGTGTLTLDSIFTINITDTNDAPIAADDSLSPAIISAPVIIDVRANDTDADGDTLAVTAVGTPVNGTTSYNATSVTYTPDADYSGIVTFGYTVSDNHSGGALTDSADVTLQVVADKARGDCNGDGNVDAGDFAAIILEEVDDDGSPNRWYNSYQGSFVGSPMGCDANRSETINIADLSCTVLVFFGDTACTAGVVAAAQVGENPIVSIGQHLVDSAQQQITVPLNLQTNGSRIAAASFTLMLDPQQVLLAETDVNEDSIPDAVELHLPDGMASIVTYSALTGRLDLTVFGTRIPMPVLQDGTLADITLQIGDGAITEIPLLLIQGSLGSDQGQSLPLTVDSGVVRRAERSHQLYLPMVLR